MPTIGLVVEGEYDEVAIEVLIKRSRKGVKVVPRQCRGTVTAAKLRGILAELKRSYRLEKVLIVRDTDGGDPASLIAAMKNMIVGTFSFSIHPLVAVEALEAWLLADPLALENALGVKKKFPNPEKIRDPKAQLEKLLSRRTAYTPELAKAIAEKMDLNVLKTRCPWFATFQRAILRPRPS
jgi:hypothetical protein